MQKVNFSDKYPGFTLSPANILCKKIFEGVATAKEREDYLVNYASEAERILNVCYGETKTTEEYLTLRVLQENLEEGTLEGGDCRLCRNKGYIVGYTNGYEWQKECSCMAHRRAKESLQLSEYEEYITSKTFNNFEIVDEQHRYALRKAREFLRQKKYPFLYVGGTTGTGKSHLTVATYYQFILQGKQGHFVKWENEIGLIRAEQFSDPIAYKKRMKNLKYAEVLLIDDILWNSEGKEPTAYEWKIAKEILDERSIRNLPTLMSSNYTMSELFNLNPVVGGRISEFAGTITNFAVDLNGTNYRLKEGGQLELTEEKLPF